MHDNKRNSQAIKSSLWLFDGYGENRDALWDCLYCWYDESTNIEIEGVQYLKENGLEESAEKLLEVFACVREQGYPLYATVSS